jgi:hypothetical protein
VGSRLVVIIIIIIYQLAAQQTSPRGEVVTAQTARGQLNFFNPPHGRAMLSSFRIFIIRRMLRKLLIPRK